MGIGYELVNATKREVVSFAHLPVNTKSEIYRNPVTATLVCWYLTENIGDEVQFVSDTYDDWPFKRGKRSELKSFKDVTDSSLKFLISIGIFSDLGYEYQDEDEPESVYIRAIEVASRNET